MNSATDTTGSEQRSSLPSTAQILCVMIILAAIGLAVFTTSWQIRLALESSIQQHHEPMSLDIGYQWVYLGKPLEIELSAKESSSETRQGFIEGTKEALDLTLQTFSVE